MRKVTSRLTLAGLMIVLLLGPVYGATIQKITITMRDFSFTPANVALQAGVPAEMRLINKGKVAHEFMVYDVPKQMTSMAMGHKWVEKTNYFRGLAVTVEGGKSTLHGRDLLEVAVAAGKTATLKFTPTRKGTFEFGCMYEGHYEAGQRGTLTVK